MLQNVVRVGVGIIIIKKSSVLLGKRLNSHGNGEYSFPSGHLEFGESIENCAKRETAEETGLKIFNVQKVQIFSDDWYPQEQKRFITLYVTALTSFRADPVCKEPDKCEGWGWHEWNNLPHPLFQGINKLKNMGFSPIEHNQIYCT